MRSKFVLVLFSAMICAGICTVASAAQVATQTYKKTRCPNVYPGSKALAEDLARNIEANANANPLTVTDGTIQKKIKLSKVKVSFTRPSIKLFRGATEVTQPLDLTGAETSGKTFLGNHTSFSAPSSGSSQFVVNISPMTNGQDYKCQYKFNARISSKAYREWKEGTTDKSERVINFKIAAVNDLVKEIPLYAIAKNPSSSGR